MKSYHWFIIGILLLTANIIHAFMTSFLLIHYAIIALSTFFIIGAFIVAGGDGENLYSSTMQAAKYVSKNSKKSNFNKTIIYLIIIAIASFVYFFFKPQIISYAKSISWIWSIISHIDAQIQGSTLLGLFYAAFIGALFFIPMPVELIFIYYLKIYVVLIYHSFST